MHGIERIVRDMKKLSLLAVLVLACVLLASCNALLDKAKQYVTGNEASEKPAGYLTTLKNELFEYDVFKNHISVTKYLAESVEVEIPSEIDGKPVTEVGSLCFYQTEAKVVSVTIPDSVTAITESAFYCADRLSSIVIPDSVTEIGMRAFAQCEMLETVVVGSGVKSIPDYCFNCCDSLKQITFRGQIDSIGVRAFSYCSALTEYEIPSSVNKIGARAFCGCESLEYLTFINTEVEIGADAFSASEKLALIAPEGSAVYKYCEANSLRWTTSKSVPAIKLGTSDESSDESSASTEEN